MEKTSRKMNVPYFQVPNAVFDADLNLSAYERLVYLYLCRCSNQGAEAYPGYGKIAKRCGISKTTARTAILNLEKKGFITVKRRPKSNKDNLPNLYKLKTLPVSCRYIGISGDDIAPLSRDDTPVSCGDTYKEPLIKNTLIKNPEEAAVYITKEEDQKNLVGVIGYYKDQVKLRSNFKPGVKPAEGKALKKLLQQFSQDQVKAMLEEMFKDNDPYYKQEGWPLMVFCSQVNKFAARIYGRNDNNEVDRYKVYNRLQREREQKEKEAWQQEQVRRAALTEEERRLEDINSRRHTLNALTELRQDLADFGDQEAAAKVKKYQAELQALADEEAQLQQSPALKKGDNQWLTKQQINKRCIFHDPRP